MKKVTKQLNSFLLVLFTACMPQLSTAQNNADFDIDENLPKIITEPDRKIKFGIAIEELSFTPDKDLFYYSFKHNKIFITQGGYDGVLLNGKYAEFYTNENLKESGYFKNGLKHGIWTQWYINGVIKTRTEWNNGKRNGIMEEYSETGKLVKKTTFQNNMLHGDLVWYKPDTTILIKYKNGVIVPVKKKK